jgi:RNA polymerase sigma factor (sigma-70 family)
MVAKLDIEKIKKLDIAKIKERDEDNLRQFLEGALPFVKEAIREKMKTCPLTIDKVERTLLIEDIAADTFVTFIERLNMPDSIRATKPEQLVWWCQRVAKNLLWGHLRELERRERFTAIYEGKLPTSDDPADFTLDLESKELLYKEMQRLGEIEKHVFELRLNGWSIREIAEAEGLPRGTVHQISRRGVVKLRYFLEEEGYRWHEKA